VAGGRTNHARGANMDGPIDAGEGISE
jgi:hypothetical protein